MINLITNLGRVLMTFKDLDYLNCIKKVVTNKLLEWKSLENKRILIVGYSGGIGSFLIECLMYKNQVENSNITIFVLERNNDDKIETELFSLSKSKNLKIIPVDNISNYSIAVKCDIILDLSTLSNRNSIITIIEETKSMLDYASMNKVERIISLSSTEIYGECSQITHPISENDNGHIDINSSLTVAKRLRETLIQAYIQEHNLNIVIPRIPKILEAIPLKTIRYSFDTTPKRDCTKTSKLLTYYQYLYIFETAAALLFLLTHGENGAAYNINIQTFDNILIDIYQKLECTSLDNCYLKMNTLQTHYINFDSTKLLNLGWRPIFEEEIHL
jgi:UDP-glucuronate decarboxylase